MILTMIQYDAIMMAIEVARDLNSKDELLDPYAERPAEYTQENLEKALKEVE